MGKGSRMSITGIGQLALMVVYSHAVGLACLYRRGLKAVGAEVDDERST